MPPLDLSQLSELNFEEPDTDRFPCLELAYEALHRGGTAPAALNAANEVAVAAFLDGKITIPDIARLNSAVLDSHETKPVNNLESVLDADRDARLKAEALCCSAATMSETALSFRPTH